MVFFKTILYCLQLALKLAAHSATHHARVIAGTIRHLPTYYTELCKIS